MGKKLDAARRELELAERSLSKMSQATVMSDITEHWEDILGRLTRLSNKTTASLKGDPRFTNSPHVKRVNQALKSDPLIQYLARARDVHEHKSDPITTDLPAGIVQEASLPNGGRIYVRNLRMQIGSGAPVPIPLANADKTYQAPDEVVASPIEHRDRRYEVPVEHLGNPIPDRKLSTLAALGIDFYRAFLDGLAADGWDTNNA